MDAEQTTRLRRAVSKLARELNASATDEQLTPTQYSVLALVAARGPLSLSTLTGLERVNPTMLSRVVGKLDATGLVRRRSDAADQRAVRVEVTGKGRRVHERVRAQRNAVVSGCVAELPPDQAAALTAAIPALEALVDRLAAR